MNILLWIVQVLLALHTAMGAFWKFSNPEQSVPSLEAIPHTLWIGLAVVELVCSAALLVPALNNALGTFAVVAAACIAAEMLLFSAVALSSSATNVSNIVYWLIVAAVCTFVVYGRLVLRPF